MTTHDQGEQPVTPSPWDCRPRRDCCAEHDGPHAPECVIPRTHEGFTHLGTCILPADPIPAAAR